MSIYMCKEADGSLTEHTVPNGITHAQVMAQLPNAVLQDGSLPDGRLFRAWDMDSDGNVTVDIAKGKELLHNVRRAKRAKQFESDLDVLDRKAKGIPLASGESSETALASMTSYKEDTDDVRQAAIDAAVTEQDLVELI